MVNPSGQGVEDAEFGTSSRQVTDEDPMFGDVENLKVCMTDSKVDQAIMSFMKTLEIPGYETRISRPSIKRKGNHYVQISVSVTFKDESGSPALRFPQTWFIEVDLWGFVRGYRNTYDAYMDLENEEESIDNDPEEEDSMSVQLEGSTIEKIQSELKEALEAFLYPWASSASREASIIRVQWLKHIGGQSVTPAMEDPASTF
jgi:hypothetical protein